MQERRSTAFHANLGNCVRLAPTGRNVVYLSLSRWIGGTGKPQPLCVRTVTVVGEKADREMERYEWNGWLGIRISTIFAAGKSTRPATDSYSPENER